ncbi:VanZ family protein [Gynurincola endophyticus]|uniref:VanZ family protein n=1 Tax=Gynurincola endophyticus TaxID=2479004 RepID=UPI000F8CC5CE|nr:VanZ family protein [Gynurincola endophyticus]
MTNLAIRICRQLWFPLLWTAIIIWLLCIPGTSLSSFPKWWKFPGYDKVVHLLLFGSFVVVWAFHYERFRLSMPVLWKRLVVIFTILSILLGIILEFVQKYYIPFRSFDVNDIYADALGALLAGAIIYWWRAPHR